MPYKNKVKEVLGCEVIEANRDECCGFGRVFSVKEGEMSYIIGLEKLNDLLSNWRYDFTPTITGVDMSCLMHLEAIAKKDGIEVVFAKDAKEHNETLLHYLRKINAKKVVKSKSMLTEECGLNEFLEKNGIEVIDTDLGERIVKEWSKYKNASYSKRKVY